jgi:hypothetical protein
MRKRDAEAQKTADISSPAKSAKRTLDTDNGGMIPGEA